MGLHTSDHMQVCHASTVQHFLLLLSWGAACPLAMIQPSPSWLHRCLHLCQPSQQTLGWTQDLSQWDKMSRPQHHCVPSAPWSPEQPWSIRTNCPWPHRPVLLQLCPRPRCSVSIYRTLRKVMKQRPDCATAPLWSLPGVTF